MNLIHKILNVAVALIFLTSCSQGKVVDQDMVNNLELQQVEVIETPTPNQEFPLATSVAQPYALDRVLLVEDTILRLTNMVKESKVSDFEQIVSFLQSCSILVPYESDTKVVKTKTDNCYINVIGKEDRSNEFYSFYFDQFADTFAFYSFSDNMIFLNMESVEVLDPDYLALVLFHEGVHAGFQEGCTSQDDYQCRAEIEAMAYIFEFGLMDYLGNKNNPNYQKTISKTAEKMAENYGGLENISFPDYEKSSGIREFFNSPSTHQDELYLSLMWLRTHFEMYVQIHGDWISAEPYFIDFLQEMYKSGALS